MTRQDLIRRFRKTKTKVNLAASEVFEAHRELLLMRHTPAAGKAHEIYEQINKLVEMLEWVESITNEISLLANE